MSVLFSIKSYQIASKECLCGRPDVWSAAASLPPGCAYCDYTSSGSLPLMISLISSTLFFATTAICSRVKLFSYMFRIISISLSALPWAMPFSLIPCDKLHMALTSSFILLSVPKECLCGRPDVWSAVASLPPGYTYCLHQQRLTPLDDISDFFHAFLCYNSYLFKGKIVFIHAQDKFYFTFCPTLGYSLGFTLG